MFKKIKNHFNKKNLNNPSYEYLFDEPKSDEFVCFDCETTGLDVKKDDIICIGALKIKNNFIQTSDSFERLVKPKTKLSDQSIQIHQIRKIDLKNAKLIDEVLDEFLEFIGNSILVGYYLEFDIAMINKYLKPKLGITLPNKAIEVSALYHDYKNKAIPQSHIDLRFDTLLNDLDIPHFSKHVAINDALMAALMFVKLKNIKKRI